MTDLQNQLQTALGGTYVIARELGGGGMSRVFLATEAAFDRKVVIKVLPPEMGAGVNQERFQREIQLAARLQHPHIVPLLTAGATGDLRYFVMPFIEGESLRAKLSREGELPVAEAVRYLRDVTDALAYAHAQGVVHRDIKPDNVLISGRHALVTDFGVAKALSVSSGSTLTSLGLALGTPAYMAPEQAAGDPHLDHRADLYATGLLGYEMLTGRLPFSGSTPQALLAAHVTEVPEPVERYRPAVPAPLAALLMRCLEKKPADRWQRADELNAALDAVATTAASTPTDTAPVSAVRLPADLAAATRVAQPGRVALWFAAAAVALLAAVYLVVQLAGLPDWVLLATGALLFIGFPIMVATGTLEGRRARARATGVPTVTPTAGLPAFFTWRRALLGGGAAFAVLGLLTGGWAVTRALGVGPAGTLLTSGALDAEGRLVIARFANRTADSTLTRTVTELFRIGINQSPVVKLVSEQGMAEILQRMQRPTDAEVDEAVAREIVEREGLKAYVAGEIAPVGRGYLVSARLLTPAGEILTAQQVSASDESGIIAAVDQLSARVRERIGESLRTIRRTGPLDQVTTGSLEALRLYAQGLAAENAGDDARAVGLFERAVAFDSGFAMAYRKIGTILGNNFEERDRAVAMLTRAYQLRDRLSDRERAYAEGMYYSRVVGDPDQTVAAYRTLLERYPDDYIALNNMGVAYYMMGDLERAVEAYRRGVEADSSRVLGYGNLATTQVENGQLAAAESTLARLDARFPGNPRALIYRRDVAYARGDYETSERLARQVRDLAPAPGVMIGAARMLAQTLLLQGRLAEAEREARAALSVAGDRGFATEYLNITVDLTMADLLRDAPAAGLRRLDEALRRYPLNEITPLDRPYGGVAYALAALGQPARARQLVRDWEATGRTAQGEDARWLKLTTAVIDVAEQRYDAALDNIRAFGTRFYCRVCADMMSALAYDGAGRADSALAYWEAYATSPQRMLWWDFGDLARAYKRLGELYEARGDRERAVEWYGKFTELWQGADPDLQPVVADVRRRMQRLAGERPS
jgi:tetratricopeptide (TPR) repeat protein/tRNA A-37 threonylcarbamoyl transferase component Bud32